MNDIKGEIIFIIEKYLFEPNTEETRINLINNIKSFLDKKIYDGIICSYGHIEVKIRKDTILLNINPEIQYKNKDIKYIYTGEAINSEFFELTCGGIYNVKCDVLTLEPQSIIFNNGYKIPIQQSGARGKEIFKKMFEDGYFIELSKYRDKRINDILDD